MQHVIFMNNKVTASTVTHTTHAPQG